MRSHLMLQCLVLSLVASNVVGFGPLAKEGLGDMLGFFNGIMGGMGGAAEGAANQAQGGLGSIIGGIGDGLGSITNGLGGGLGSIANGLGGGLGGIIQQIFSSWGSIMSQLMNGGGDIFSTLFGVLKSMIENFFSIFGSLGGSSRLQINKMIAGSGNVFASVMKLKLNPEKNQDKLKKEILAVQKIVESKHAHPNDMIKAIKSKAPQLHLATTTAFSHAKVEFQKHMKALNPEAKKGIQKMQLQVAKAKFDFGSALSMIPQVMGAMSGIMSTGMSLITNLFNAFKMVF